MAKVIPSGPPRSKPCPECSQSGRSGRLELITIFSLDLGKEITFALCNQRGCTWHVQKMPLSMYESRPGDQPGK